MKNQGLGVCLTRGGVCDRDRDRDRIEGGRLDEAMLWEGVKRKFQSL